MDKLKKKKHPFSKGNGYMWPNENDSTTLLVMRVFLKMEKKNAVR